MIDAKTPLPIAEPEQSLTTAETNLPATTELDVSPEAVWKRRIKMATEETIDTVGATAQALASLQQHDGNLARLDVVEKALCEHLRLMKERRDTSCLQELMYLEARILHATFLDLMRQANAPNIHPTERRWLLELAFKCQRHSRVTSESLARIVAPVEPKTVIQNTSAVQINNAEEKIRANELLDLPE